MTVRIAVFVLVAVALAGCSGDPGAVTVTGPTVAETATVTETVRDHHDVADLAEALCREYGPLARTFGGLSGDEEVAEAFAGEVEPELRQATREGCLAGLASE
jgi:hypothetical protein